MLLRVFRKRISPEEIAEPLKQQRLDFNSKFYRPITASVTEIVRETELLSRIDSQKIPTRSRNVIHAAHVLVLVINEFLTYDAPRRSKFPSLILSARDYEKIKVAAIQHHRPSGHLLHFAGDFQSIPP